MLQRSTDEAALLARRLTPADKQRMWAFALCLARAQCRLPPQPTTMVERLLTLCVDDLSGAGSLPTLPTPITWRLLALCLAD